MRIWFLVRMRPGSTAYRHTLFRVATRTLVRASSFRIRKDATMLWIDDGSSLEVHVDAASGDQQVDLISSRNAAKPFQHIAQKNPRIYFDRSLDGRVDKSRRA